MTEEVKFIRGNDRISQLAQRPDIADGGAAHVEEREPCQASDRFEVDNGRLLDAELA